MKNTFFLLVLIFGMVMVVASCKKDENTSSISTGCKAVTSCSATASSDNITGISGGWMSGTYDKMIIHANSGLAVDNTTGCVSQSSLLSGPTGTNSLRFQHVVTGANSYADTASYYSDTSCSSPILTYTFGKEFTLGNDLTGLTASNLPSTATQFTYKDSCFEIYPYNEVASSFIDALFASAGINTTAGTKMTCQDSGDTNHGLFYVADSSWDGAAADNRTLVMNDRGDTAFSTWNDPNSYTRID